jgi:16S rRNA (uracil1498-N3)-methyltransferase
MARRYHVDPLPAPGRCRLGGGLAHHLGTVLRGRPGECVVLFDGQGRSCEARVLAARGRELEVEVGAARTEPGPAVRVHLAFAPPRWSRAEWLFEHGTEVGVQVFHPLRSERVRPQPDRRERWQKLCAQAAGQCDRSLVPEVRAVRDLGAFLADPELPAERWLCDPDGPPLGPARSDAAVLLVGPEGGLSGSEREAAVAHGFVPASLGPHVLRTETAALLGAALLYGIGKHDSSAKL